MTSPLPPRPHAAAGYASVAEIASFLPSGRATAAEAAVAPYRFLGAFRFLLAALVLVSHASPFVPAVTPLSLGNVGVFLFFVVSGFVIAEALDLFYVDRTGSFLLNRCLKIFPGYWAALALAVPVAILVGQGERLFEPWAAAVNLSLLLAYLPSGGSLVLISIAWAVIVEFQFYLLAAATAAAGALLPQRGAALLGASVLALALYGFVWSTGAYARFFGMFQFAPFFVLGVLLYFVLARQEGRLVPLVVLAGALSLHAFHNYLSRGVGTVHVEIATVLFLAGCVLFAVLATRSIPRALERLDKILGDLTYALYLVHMSLVALALHFGFEGMTGFAFVAAGAFAAALLVHLGVERPLIRFRNQLRGRAL